MATLDAASVGQLAVKVGLIDEGQLQQAWAEAGPSNDPEPLLLALERKGRITPWHSSKLLKGDPDGYFLGGYRILYKIASGTFGRVYRAEDPRTGTVVAIKVLRRKWSEDKHSIELFEREGKVGMSLRHPNLVEILAINRDLVTRQYYIVMEFVEGGNLREILAIRKKLDAPTALRMVEDAASGLSYAYSRGVTHRDMKLTNVLISSSGTAKLVDFGLAGVYRSLKPEENSQVDRTVDYAGLEKATGVAHGDVRSDIYFLGCILYEILAGRPPLLMTRDAKARMNRYRFTEVKPLTPQDVQAPASVFHLVETMMSLNPMQRFQTPSQLLEAIREVRQEVAGQAKGTNSDSQRSLFIVERDEGLQDKLREGFKKLGYRVFIASDPVRALDRYRQKPYDALVVDAGTVGEDGLLLFDRVMAEAERHGSVCRGVLILSEAQANWVHQVKARGGVAVMVQPVTGKQLHRKLQELLGTPAKVNDSR
jgi:serine/threonine protein kinase